MRNALLAFALVVAAVAASGSAIAATRHPGVTIFAGPPLRKPVVAHSDALAFFPSKVTIHAGDTVTWQLFGFHTVTFAGPKGTYPFVVPSGTQPATNDAGGSPFWWSGKLPQLTVSPLALLPQGGATISSPAQVRNSGLVRILNAKPHTAPAPFSLTFTKPGVYHYLCAVHPGMRGVVVVLSAKTRVPSIATEAVAATQSVTRALADQKQLSKTVSSVPLQVLVGAGNRSTGAEVTAFFPSQLTVSVGDTVAFVNHDQTDIHTVTFGPDPFRSAIEKTFVAPQGRQVLLNPLGALPSEPPGPVSYDGTNHGNGYLNSGLLQPQGAPASLGPNSFSVTFTKAGVYHYECVVHAGMDGTIVVQ